MFQVQCYDPETDSWQLRACIPFTKPNISAVSLNNVIYVCGGLTKSIYCYDPSQDHWMHVGHSFSRQVPEAQLLINQKVERSCHFVPYSDFIILCLCVFRRVAGYQFVTERSTSWVDGEKMGKHLTTLCAMTRPLASSHARLLCLVQSPTMAVLPYTVSVRNNAKPDSIH